MDNSQEKKQSIETVHEETSTLQLVQKYEIYNYKYAKGLKRPSNTKESMQTIPHQMQNIKQVENILKKN